MGVWSGRNAWWSLFNFTMPMFIVGFIYNVYWTLAAMLVYLVAFFAAKEFQFRKKLQKTSGVHYLDADVVRDKDYSQEIFLGFIKSSKLYLGDIDINQTTFYKKIELKVQMETLAEFEDLDEKDRKKLIEGMKLSAEEKKKEEEVNEKIKKASDGNLGTLRAYMVTMSEKKAFQDTFKHTFENMVLVTRRPIEDDLIFSQTLMNVDNWLITGFSAKCSLIVLGWITNDIPVFYIHYSERDAVDKIDAVIDAGKVKDIQLTTMQRMIFSLRNFFNRFELDIEEKKEMNDAETKRSSRLIQMLKNEREKLDDIGSEYLDYGKIKLKVWQTIFLGSGWFVVLSMLLSRIGK